MISETIAFAGVEIVPPRAAMVGAGHARRQKGAAFADAEDGMRSRIQEPPVNFMRVDESARSPPLMPAPALRGMIAPRVDDATANAPDCTTTSARMSATLRTSSSVCTSSASVTSQVPTDDRR